MHARDLSNRLSDLLRREQGAMAEFLVALADFDAKRVWVELGYPSLFAYLHRELRLSKGAAHYRKTAAELIQRFPEVVEPVKDGRLCITVVCELAKVLAPENRDQVIPRFFHLSKDEARAVVAELRPMERPPRREVVTTVRVAAAAPLLAPASALDAATAASSPACPTEAGSMALGFPADHLDAKVPAPTVNAPVFRPERPTFQPLTAELRRLSLTVSRRFEAKVAEARDALSHSHPGASTEVILEAALDLLLDRTAKRKGLVKKPRRVRQPSESDHVPAEVKRTVWVRDGGCCQWPLENGGICGSRHRLQYDHIRPRALGGQSTVDNVRLLCGGHNLLAARRIFGDAWMDRYAPDQAAARVERERRASSPARSAEEVSATSVRGASP